VAALEDDSTNLPTRLLLEAPNVRELGLAVISWLLTSLPFEYFIARETVTDWTGAADNAYVNTNWLAGALVYLELAPYTEVGALVKLTVLQQAVSVTLLEACTAARLLDTPLMVTMTQNTEYCVTAERLVTTTVAPVAPAR